MFIAIPSYVHPLENIDALIPDHARFLDQDRAQVLQVLEPDPFKRQGVATYELIEFSPTKLQAGFDAFL